MSTSRAEIFTSRRGCDFHFLGQDDRAEDGECQGVKCGVKCGGKVRGWVEVGVGVGVGRGLTGRLSIWYILNRQK